MQMVPMNSVKFAKEGMRLPQKVYYLGFNEKEEESIVWEVLKYTSNFFVLITGKEIVNFKNFIYCDANNIHDALSIVRGGDSKIANRFEHADNCNRLICIFLFSENEKCKFDYLRNRRMREFQITSNLLLKLNLNFSFHDYYVVNNNMVIRLIHNNFFDSRGILKSKNHFENNLILFFRSGIGDVMLNCSMVYEYLKHSSFDPSKTFIVLEKNSIQEELFRTIVPEYNILYFPSLTMILYFLEVAKKDNPEDERGLHEFKGNYVFDLTSLSGEGHIYDLINKRLFGEVRIAPFKHHAVIKEKIIHSIDHSRKELIDNVFRKKSMVIGFQFFTGDYISESKYVGKKQRCWNEHNARLFCDICKENNIELLIISPHPFADITGTFTLGELSLQEYIYAISKLTMVVGIDSSGGHIASFFDIPNLTIWGEQTPLVWEGKQVSFRTIRNNYSIVPQNGDINSIDACTVYEKMIDFLNSKTTVKKDTITFQDSKDGYNMYFV